MSEINQQSVVAEINKYNPYKTYVNVYRVNHSGEKKSRQKWFEGLVTKITDRGIFINAMREEPHAESMDILCGQFVPYTIFNPEIEIQIVKKI
jgi:hypothetical protein